MKARDYDDMRRVFLEEPYRLLTADIQSAFMHLSSGGKENEISFLNSSGLNVDDGYYAKPEGFKSKSVLDPIGIKDIHLKLVIPKQVINLVYF